MHLLQTLHALSMLNTCYIQEEMIQNHIKESLCMGSVLHPEAAEFSKRLQEYREADQLAKQRTDDNKRIREHAEKLSNTLRRWRQEDEELRRRWRQEDEELRETFRREAQQLSESVRRPPTYEDNGPVTVIGVQGTYSNLLNGVYNPVLNERRFAGNWSKLKDNKNPIYENSNDFGIVRLYFDFDHWFIEGVLHGQHRRLMQSIKDKDRKANVVNDVRKWQVAVDPNDRTKSGFETQEWVQVTTNPYTVKKAQNANTEEDTVQEQQVPTSTRRKRLADLKPMDLKPMH